MYRGGGKRYSACGPPAWPSAACRQAGESLHAVAHHGPTGTSRPPAPQAEGYPRRQPDSWRLPPGHRLFIVTICARRPLSACLWSPPQRMNVVSGDHHGRPFLHPLQQDPRASTPPGSARRQSSRLQPASSSRPHARAPYGRPASPGAQGNHRRSHRRPGRTISLASGCGKATLREPAFLPADGGSHGGKRRLSGALPTGEIVASANRMRR